MTTFYVRRSVEKAFQEDEMPTGLSLSMSKTIQTNAPYIISAVDVVMYIVNAVVQRTLDTSQRDVVAAVVPAVARVLGADFIGMVQRKMRDESYPKPLVQGGYPPEDKIIAFVVLINSLDVANEYLARIINGRLGLTDSSGADQANGAAKTQAQARLRESFPFENDATFVASALSTLLSSFTAKSTELLTEGVQVLFRQVVRLRLVPVLADTWRDADYSLSAEELDEAARRLAEEDTTWDGSSDPAALLQEQVSRRFEHGWDALMRPLQRIMRPATFTALLDATARHLAAVLEKRAWSYAGRATPLGAVRMERDFGAIVATVSRGNYAARELFARTQQVLMIANMEDDEWDELVASGGGDGADEDATGIKWVLSEEEKRKARMLVKG